MCFPRWSPGGGVRLLQPLRADGDDAPPQRSRRPEQQQASRAAGVRPMRARAPVTLGARHAHADARAYRRARTRGRRRPLDPHGAAQQAGAHRQRLAGRVHWRGRGRGRGGEEEERMSSLRTTLPTARFAHGENKTMIVLPQIV